MVTLHTDLATFRQRVVPLLVPREAENNLILGLVSALKPDQAVLLVEVDGVGAAVCTPPHNLIVTDLPEVALDALLARLIADGVKLPGVIGPTAAARHFAHAWAKAHGRSPRLHHSLRIFENRSLIPPRPPIDGGRLRLAGDEDLELVLRWTESFNQSVGTSTPTARAVIAGRLQSGDFALWVTDRAVSMAAVARRTPNGAAVAYVYTPPELRGRGYASACVAALTQRLHDDGRIAFLFTDLSNPTSNKIYQAIGYRAVANVDEWRYDAPP